MSPPPPAPPPLLTIKLLLKSLNDNKFDEVSTN
jgi:hypothetical protein